MLACDFFTVETVALRRLYGRAHARSRAAGERLRRAVRPHHPGRMPRPPPDHRPPPPRTSPLHLPPALHQRAPPPRTRTPTARAARAQIARRRRPAPRPPRRPHTRVLPSRGLTESSFDTLQVASGHRKVSFLPPGVGRTRSQFTLGGGCGWGEVLARREVEEMEAGRLHGELQPLPCLRARPRVDARVEQGRSRVGQ
jgi:hypothetical protein